MAAGAGDDLVHRAEVRAHLTLTGPADPPYVITTNDAGALIYDQTKNLTVAPFNASDPLANWQPLTTIWLFCLWGSPTTFSTQDVVVNGGSQYSAVLDKHVLYTLIMSETPDTWYLLGAPPMNNVTVAGGSSITALGSHIGKLVQLTGTGPTTVTLPALSVTASLNVPVGAEIDYVWWSAAAAPTFAAGSGQTMRATPGPKLRAQYSVATVKRVANLEWLVIGDLSA